MASTSSAGKITWRGADDSEDEELEQLAAHKAASKTALLLIIDATPDMFESSWGDNEDTPFRAALKCCVSTCRSKIVSSPRDLVAIMFAGTEKEQNPPAFPNFFLMYPLTPLKVEVIEELHKMASQEEFEGFHERVGSTGDYNLKDLFWLSKIIFENAKAGTVNQKLIYFTCEDNPHARNRNLRSDSIQKFKDLGTVDFNIVTFKTDFMHEHFYKNLFSEPSRITFPEDLPSLLQVVRMKQKTNRPISRLSLQIYKGINIAVGVYSLARSALPPKQVRVNEKNNELVTKTVNTFRADTGTTVLKSEQVKVATVMGEMVAFEKDELRVARNAGTTGMTILGYLPRAKFDEFVWFRKEGYFLYPDEERIVGSTDLFKVLLRRCNVLGKVPIVKMVLTRGRSAKLACLIPSIGETLSSTRPIPGSGARSTPCPGFYVCQLPFADELRTHDLAPGRQASSELVTLMEKIIRKTSNKNFDLQSVQNPTLQLKYRQIESIALQGEAVTLEDQAFQDYTEPNDDVMHTRVGPICDEVNNLAEIEHGQTSALPVRQAAPKREINMAMEAKHKRLEKLTCAILSEFLAANDIPTQRLTKPKLIEKVYAFFGDE